MLLKKLRIDVGKLNSTLDLLVTSVRSRIQMGEEGEYRIRLVVKELMTNILTYSDADAVVLSASLLSGVLTIQIDDNGAGFCYDELLVRDVTRQDFLMRESGRGVFLVRAMADGVQFNDKGNSVRIVLNLNEK